MVRARRVATGHPPGPTSLAVLPDGALLTCGVDGTVRRLSASVVAADRAGMDGEMTDDGAVVHEVEDGKRIATCVAVDKSGATLFVASKDRAGGVDGYVSAVDGTEGSERERLHQTPLGVRDLCVSPDDVHLAVALERDGIFVVEWRRPVDSFDYIGDHSGAVKALKYDPTGELLASLGADGALKLHSRLVPSRTAAHTVANVTPRDSADADPSEARTRFSLAWEPQNGARLAVGGADGARLRVFSRGRWSMDAAELWAPPSDAAWAEHDRVTAVTWSPDAKLVAGCVNGPSSQSYVVVWDTASHRAAHMFAVDAALYDARFVVPSSGSSLSAMDATLVVTDGVGFVRTFHLQSATEVVPGADRIEATATSAQIPDKEPLVSGKLGRDTATGNDKLAERDDEEDDAPETSVERAKAELGLGGSGGDGTESTKPLKSSMAGAELSLDDHAEFARLSNRVRELEDRVVLLDTALAEHDTFQPSAAAPVETEDRHFLVWNAVGSLVSRDAGASRVIDVAFADEARRAHRTILDPDSCFEFGALCETGALLASRGLEASSRRSARLDIIMGDDVVAGVSDEDDDLDADAGGEGGRRRDSATAAVVSWTQFDSVGIGGPASGDWSLTLPAGEQVLATACSTEICVVATSRDLLRTFRPDGGLQEAPIALPGSAVSLAASLGLVLVLYQTAEGGVAHLLYNFGSRVERFVGPRVVAAGPLLSKTGRAVKWVGFADETLGYMPVCSRDDGLLLGLSVAAGWSWIALLDAKSAAKASKLWPIAVDAESGLLAIQTRAGNRRDGPAAFPRPLPVAFALRAPLLGLPARSSSSDSKKSRAVDASALKFESELEVVHSILVVAQRRWAYENVAAPLSDDETELMRAEARADLVALKHFVFCLKTGRASRALGLAKRFRLDRTLEIACAKAVEASAPRDVQEALIALRDAREEAAAQGQVADIHAEDDDHEEEEEGDDKGTNDGVRATRAPSGLRVGFHGKRLSSNFESPGVKSAVPPLTTSSEPGPTTSPNTSAPSRKSRPTPKNPFVTKAVSPGKRRGTTAGAAAADLGGSFSTSPVREPVFKKAALVSEVSRRLA